MLKTSLPRIFSLDTLRRKFFRLYIRRMQFASTRFSLSTRDELQFVSTYFPPTLVGAPHLPLATRYSLLATYYSLLNINFFSIIFALRINLNANRNIYHRRFIITVRFFFGDGNRFCQRR